MHSTEWGESNLDLTTEFQQEVTRRQPAIPQPQWLERLLNWAGGKPEIQISQRSDRHGNLFWHVYDPQGQQSAQFSTEAEVRIWLEQRHLS